MGREKIDEAVLFDEALKEFTQYSYEKASLNRIINNAKITKGSFYYRFPNKYELYLFLMKESNKKKWEYINNNNETQTDKPNNEGDIFDLFLRQAETGVRFGEIYPQYNKLGKMFSKEKGNPVYSRVINDLQLSEEAGLNQIISNAYNSGYFHQRYSLEFINRLVTSLFYSFDEIIFKNEDYSVEKALSYLKEFVDFLKYGLKASL